MLIEMVHHGIAESYVTGFPINMLTSTKPTETVKTKRPITSSLQEHSQFCGREAYYEAWTNHNACLEHREWWRDLRLSTTFMVLTTIAASAFYCAYTLNRDSEIVEHFSASMKTLLTHKIFRSTVVEAQFSVLRENGEQFIKEGKIHEGIACFKKAEKLAPVADSLKADLFNDLAVAEHQIGNTVESIVYFNKAVQLAPEMKTARSNLLIAKHVESIDTWK